MSGTSTGISKRRIRKYFDKIEASSQQYLGGNQGQKLPSAPRPPACGTGVTHINYGHGLYDTIWRALMKDRITTEYDSLEAPWVFGMNLDEVGCFCMHAKFA